MPSRDRLAETSFRFSIEKELEDIIKNHTGLRDLQNRRRKEAIENKLRDSKPLADVLEDIIKKSPALSNLFLKGVRIKNPFKMEGASKQEEFKGKKFPTYFNITKNYSESKPKPCQIKRKFRIQYETDAENNYFNRDNDPGEMILKIDGQEIKNYSLNLWNGLATLTVNIPENAKVGDIICLKTEVSDINSVNPFTNKFHILITKEQEIESSKGKRKNSPSKKRGDERKRESYLDIPYIMDIRRKDWEDERYKEFNFNEFSALKVRNTGEESGFDFFINMDNSYLITELKGNTKTDPAVLEARYRYGMVLLGISILDFEERSKKDKKNNTDSDKNELSVYEKISLLTEAVAPTLLPMIASLGSSEFEG